MANPLHDALLAPRAGDPRPFLIPSDGAPLSQEGFLARTAQAANALAGLGVRPGDRVIVQVEKSPEALALYGGCLRLGAVFTPLNTAYTAAETEYFLGDAEPALAVVDPALAPALAAAAEAASIRVETLDAAGRGGFADAVDAAPNTHAPVPRLPDDLAAILYTSGTTGRSKGAMLTQRNLLSNAEALTEAWRFRARDVLLHALPIFHAHGLFVAINVTLLAGGALIFLPKFDTGAVIDALPRATAMMGVPTFYTRLLAREDFTRALCGHVRLFTSGSAPLLPETHAAFETRTGHRILERYGMTETGMNCSNPYDGHRRPGSVGPALPGVEVRVADPETGRPLGAGEIGVLEVRGPNVFKGYWRMPEKTAEEFRADGFFVTGDLATIGEDGYVDIVGRAKDLIITGGFNVYPREVETAIDALPGVIESAVIAAPHPDFGEAVVAVVAAAPDALRDEAAVLAGLGDLAKFKRPKRVLFRDALPRNAMGKVQKAALRAEVAGLFG